MGQDILGIDPRSRVNAGQNVTQLGQGIGAMFSVQAQMEQRQAAAQAAARKERGQRYRDIASQNLGVIQKSMAQAAANGIPTQRLVEQFGPAIRQYTEIYQADDGEVENLYAKYFGAQQVNVMNPGQLQPFSLSPQQTSQLPFTRPDGQGFGMGVPAMPLGGEQPQPEQGFGIRPTVPPLGEATAAGPGGFGIQTPDAPILGPGERMTGSFTPSDMTTEAITVGAEAERTDKLNQGDVADLRALVPTMTADDQSRATAAISLYRRTGDISEVQKVLGSYQKSAEPLYQSFLDVTGDIRNSVPLTQGDLDKLDEIERTVSESSTPSQIREARAKAQAIGNLGSQRDYLEKETIPDLENQLGELAQSTSDDPEVVALRTFYEDEWAKINDPNLTLAQKREIVDAARFAIRSTRPALARAAQTEARQNNYIGFLGNFGDVLSVEDRTKAKDLIMAGDIAGATDLAMQAVTKQKDSASVSQAFDGFMKVYDKAISANQDLATARNGILTEFDPVKREQKIRDFFKLSAFDNMVKQQVQKEQRATALEEYSVRENLNTAVAEAIQQGPEELAAALKRQLDSGVIDQETYDSELARLLPRATEAQKYAELRKKGDFAGIVTAATEAGDADVVQMFGSSAGLTPEQVAERVSRAKTVRDAGDKRRAFEMAKLDIDKGNLDLQQQDFLMSYAERLATAGAALPPELEKSPLAKSAYENKLEDIRFNKQAAKFNYDQLVGGAAYDEYTQMLSGIPQNVAEQGPYRDEMIAQLVKAGKTQAVAEAIAQGDIEKFNRGMTVQDMQVEAMQREQEDAKVSIAQRDFAFAARTIPRKTEDQAAYTANLASILVKGGYSQQEADLAAKAAVEDFNRGMNDREREIANQARLVKNQDWQQNYNKLNVVLDTIPDPGDAKAMQKFETDLAAAYRGLGYSQQQATQMAAGIANKARAQGRKEDADRLLRNEAQEVGIRAARQSIAQNTRRESQDKFELATKGIPPQTNPKSQTNYRDTTLVPQLTGMGYTKDQAIRIADGVISAFNSGARDDELTRRLREAQLRETEANINRIKTANSPESDNPTGTPYQQATSQRLAYNSASSRLEGEVKNANTDLANFVKERQVKVGQSVMWNWAGPGEPANLQIGAPPEFTALRDKVTRLQNLRRSYQRAAELLGSQPGTPLSNDQLKELGLPTRESESGPPVQGIPRQVNANNARTAYPAVQKAARALGINPDFLMNVLSKETAGTFDPAVKNPTSSATGMFQIMDDTAKEMGYVSSADFLAKNPTVDAQMNEFVRYAKRWGLRPGATQEEVYAVIAAPASLKGSSNAVVYARGSAQAQANPSWDVNKDGQITRAEIGQALANWKGDWSGAFTPKATTTTQPNPQPAPRSTAAGPGASQPQSRPQPLPASTAQPAPVADPRSQPTTTISQPTQTPQNQSPSPGLGRLTAALQSPAAKDPNTPAGAIVVQYNSALGALRQAAQQSRPTTAQEDAAIIKLAESLGVSLEELGKFLVSRVR